MIKVSELSDNHLIEGVEKTGSLYRERQSLIPTSHHIECASQTDENV